jgi:hypothetical protein
MLILRHETYKHRGHPIIAALNEEKVFLDGQND